MKVMGELPLWGSTMANIQNDWQPRAAISEEWFRICQGKEAQRTQECLTVAKTMRGLEAKGRQYGKKRNQWSYPVQGPACYNTNVTGRM